MPDVYANSTALLKQLLRQAMKKTGAVKYDRLAAEIRQVLEERGQPSPAKLKPRTGFETVVSGSLNE